MGVVFTCFFLAQIPSLKYCRDDGVWGLQTGQEALYWNYTREQTLVLSGEVPWPKAAE